MTPAVALKPEPNEDDYPYIVQTAGICGGRPRIRGSRISVRAIAGLVNQGETVDEIAATYPHLELAAIHDAIGYAYDHPKVAETRTEADNLRESLVRANARLGEDGVIRFL